MCACDFYFYLSFILELYIFVSCRRCRLRRHRGCCRLYTFYFSVLSYFGCLKHVCCYFRLSWRLLLLCSYLSVEIKYSNCIYTKHFGLFLLLFAHGSFFSYYRHLAIRCISSFHIYSLAFSLLFFFIDWCRYCFALSVVLCWTSHLKHDLLLQNRCWHLSLSLTLIQFICTRLYSTLHWHTRTFCFLHLSTYNALNVYWVG